MLSLSPRLAAIMEQVPAEAVVADIGADHGQLSMALAARSQRVIASEYGEGPYARLNRELELHAPDLGIEVRQGDGLQILQPAEADTVIIAGLGGDSIAAILRRDRELAGSMGHYLFQPMSRPRVLRELLCEWGWDVHREHLVWEERRPYVIIEARPADLAVRLSDLELEIGPQWLRTPQSDYLNYYYRRWRCVWENLQTANAEDAHKSGEFYLERLKGLEMILNGSDAAGDHQIIGEAFSP